MSCKVDFILVSIQDIFSLVSLYRELLISGHNFIVSNEELTGNVSSRWACIYSHICFGLKLKFGVLKTKKKKQLQWIAPAPADSESLIYQQSSRRANIINKNPVGVACSIHKLEIYWYHSLCMFIEWPENDSQVIHHHYGTSSIESILISNVTGLHNNIIILHLAWSYQVCT